MGRKYLFYKYLNPAKSTDVNSVSFIILTYCLVFVNIKKRTDPKIGSLVLPIQLNFNPYGLKSIIVDEVELEDVIAINSCYSEYYIVFDTTICKIKICVCIAVCTIILEC